MRPSNGDGKISSSKFWSEYHGHPVRDLKKLLPVLRASSDALIWTAGDSSLDNKYWFPDRVPAVGAYASILDPPQVKPDITYWLNRLAMERHHQKQQQQQHGDGHVHNSNNKRWAAINTAVEATTLNERTFRLRAQDILIRDNIQTDDVLVVSVGGNDVALVPCPCTIASMLCLMRCLPTSCIEQGRSCGMCPLDDYCCGCGPSLCSCLCSCPPCLGYFEHLFGTRIQKYVEALTSKTKPSKIMICMIYYPDERPSPGWAGPALYALGYDRNPSKLQAMIRKIYNEQAAKIHIPGSQVIPLALFNALNGKISDDFIERVEPSVSGGRKIAEYILDHLDESMATTGALPFINTVSAPSTTLVQGRD
jgi:hypothetical protein